MRLIKIGVPVIVEGINEGVYAPRVVALMINNIGGA